MSVPFMKNHLIYRLIDRAFIYSIFSDKIGLVK